MNPFRYILRRLLFGALVLVAVITVTFVLSRSLGGNTVVAWLGKSASIHPELAALYAKKYHLNDPIPVQYYYYILNLIQGNLGFSPSRGFQPVAEVISITLPFTLQIAFFAFVISVALGVGLGVLAAQYQHKPLDTCIRAFYLGGYSSPPFFIALILLIVFAFTFLRSAQRRRIRYFTNTSDCHHWGSDGRCCNRGQRTIFSQFLAACYPTQRFARAGHLWSSHQGFEEFNA